jgi:LPS-assembly lipoprotein
MQTLLARLVLSLALAAGLSACGLQPMYAGGRSGAVAQTLASVRVEPIPGKDGWLMRNALNDRLAAMGDAQPRYLLKVQLDDRIEGLGVRADDTVTRERRTLRARYQLVDTQDGETVLDETTGWDAGIDVVSSEYATVAAEDSALERLTDIVADRVLARVALSARQ